MDFSYNAILFLIINFFII